MNWVSENKFLTGFGAAMLAGLGTLGYLTYSAMDRYDAASSAFSTASSQLKSLEQAKPSLTDANLKELLAQKKILTEKIGAYQTELKSRVLPLYPIEKAAFQDKLKEAVARVTAKSIDAKVTLPKDFYLGFGEYQSKPPEDKAAPALARELDAIELVMNVLTKIGGVEITDKIQRDRLPEEGPGKTEDTPGAAGRRRNPAEGHESSTVERNTLKLKLTSSDDAFRKILNELANNKRQLFVIRNVTVTNSQTESPPRVANIGPAPVPPAPSFPPVTPGSLVPGETPPFPAAEPGVGTPPAAPGPMVTEAPLAYVFGTEKVVSVIELEVLKIAEARENPEKPGKKKEK